MGRLSQSSPGTKCDFACQSWIYPAKGQGNSVTVDALYHHPGAHSQRLASLPLRLRGQVSLSSDTPSHSLQCALHTATRGQCAVSLSLRKTCFTVRR